MKKIGPLKYLDNRDVSFATISDGNKVIWCGCKRGMQYLDEFRILMKRLDGTAKSRGFLQLPLSREKVLIALEQCKDCFGISPLTPKGRIRRIAATWRYLVSGTSTTSYHVSVSRSTRYHACICVLLIASTTVPRTWYVQAQRTLGGICQYTGNVS